jgi:hypothetical protein
VPADGCRRSPAAGFRLLRCLGYPSQASWLSTALAGCPSGQRERSVKPSAQPTLVRIQHLPQNTCHYCDLSRHRNDPEPTTRVRGRSFCGVPGGSFGCAGGLVVEGEFAEELSGGGVDDVDAGQSDQSEPTVLAEGRVRSWVRRIRPTDRRTPARALPRVPRCGAHITTASAMAVDESENLRCTPAVIARVRKLAGVCKLY